MSKKLSIKLGGWACTLLVITFVILKALGYLDWSWWWVFTPIWGPFALIIAVILIIIIFILLHTGLKILFKKRN